MTTRAKAGPDPALVDALVELSFTVHGLLTRAAAEHGLSVTQLRLLGILRDRTPPMGAIARHLGLDRSSITGLVDRAERRGLVARASSSRDARVTVVQITPSGREVITRVAALIGSEIGALVGHLPEGDVEALARLAGSVVDAGGRPTEGDGREP